MTSLCHLSLLAVLALPLLGLSGETVENLGAATKRGNTSKAPKVAAGLASWPQFRGEGASGIAQGAHPPLRWTLDPPQNLKWKVEIPGLGHSVAGPGLIVVTNGYRPLKPIYAIRPGASGDISLGDESANRWVAWSKKAGGSYYITPLIYGGAIFLRWVNCTYAKVVRTHKSPYRGGMARVGRSKLTTC